MSEYWAMNIHTQQLVEGINQAAYFQGTKIPWIEGITQAAYFQGTRIPWIEIFPPAHGHTDEFISSVYFAGV